MSLDVYLGRSIYTRNITHNLTKMAEEAGIYKELWRPEEIDIYHAEDLIEPLTKGLERLKSDPKHYKKFNPENGWGSYEVLVEFVEEYLKWCIIFPEARVRVDR